MHSRALLHYVLLLAGAYSTTLAEVETLTYKDWEIRTDPRTGALTGITNRRDPLHMNWLREAGGWDRQTWKADASPGANTRGGQWGLMETAYTGLLHESKTRRISETSWESIYESPLLTLTVRREFRDDSLAESYTIHNTGFITLDLSLGSVAINAPLFDQYPDAQRSLTERCHVHVWTGGNTAWINATRMNAEAPHLGLVVTEGALDAYSQRGGGHSDRGTFLLHPAAMSIPGGQSTTIAWRLFWHEGWNDFFSKVGTDENIIQLSAERYVVEVGQPLEITARSNGKLANAVVTANGKNVPTRVENDVLRATIPTSTPEEIRIDITRGNRHTWLLANVVAPPENLIDARVRFIVDHQQRLDPGHPLDGAYLAYDNETGRQIYSTVNDHNAGRERVAMGVLGALYLPLCRDAAFKTRLKVSLERYADFVAREIEGDDGTVYNNIGRRDTYRHYNWPWVAHFHLALYRATGDTAHLDRMVRVLRNYYARGGTRYYVIGLPVTDSLAALAEAGRRDEREELLANYRAHADQILANGVNYPAHEVNYEQSIVGPAVRLLLEVYLATGEKSYLDEAKRQLVILEAFCGRQPDHRLNEVAIRHWDDFWFGKLHAYGDTFPHYWSAINAPVYAYYAAATGENAWRERARAVSWANLSLFTPEGQGSAAHLYPFSSNGVQGGRDDPWANDQDWALIYLLELAKIPRPKEG